MGINERILLDTSILIEILDRGSLLNLIERKELYISIISIYEYTRYKRDKKFFKEKLKESFTVLRFDNKALLKAAEIFETLKKEDKFVSENYVYIAATAIANNLELWTKDTDFEKSKTSSLS